MHDSLNCPICRGLATPGSMSDAEFFAFLEVCRNELQIKQATFNERLEPNAKWEYELKTESLTVGRLVFPITAIGTHSSEYKTWLWAWANDTFPQAARDASTAIKRLYQVTGFKVFDDPGIDADSVDARDFAALAIHQLDAIGLFCSLSNGTTLYLAVREP